MSEPIFKMLDGNEAAADVAYRLSEVCAIYPITPSSTMAELADQWASEGRPNLWRQIPSIVEMQSEGGAAGAVHGALQSGALATTFTASQGLMLMIPNMHKIAGELSPCVFHVAARSLAAQALSIFGDHQDVMAVRNSGFALLAANSVQQAHDMALAAHLATLASRVPFVHFFDGFRTSHEVNKIEWIPDQVLRALIDEQQLFAHRARALNPDQPVIRGTAQNPDVYFQGRESSNRFYQALPELLSGLFERMAEQTGRHYGLFEYHGDPQAERIIVVMGSAVQTVQRTVDALRTVDSAQGEPVGVIAVRLFRPFSLSHLLAALPQSVRAIAVLDRTKEPGALGEPLYLDIASGLAEAVASGRWAQLPRIVGGRYGLSSKEFTPAMAKGVFNHLRQVMEAEPGDERLFRRFTVGIVDDVGHSHIDYDPSFDIEAAEVVRALFYGLGADGTVGANKNSIKILGEDRERHAQGYFVYDSKKSGSQTVSHLRFGPAPIDAPYLIRSASFIGIHQFKFVHQPHILDALQQGGTVLLNAPHPAERVWSQLPASFQQALQSRELKLFVIDAYQVARQAQMGSRINTVMQTCFFALSNIMSRDKAIAKIKTAIEKTYQRKGREVVERNFAAVDQTLAHLHRVAIPAALAESAESLEEGLPPPTEAPEFVQQVTWEMIQGRGDALPVSRIPVDGTYPSGTTQWEKREIAQLIPEWRPDLCVQCGNCSMVCPHAAIRAKFVHKKELEGAPEGFPSAQIVARGFPETRYLLQVYPQDCTGCYLCTQACPALSPKESGVKALNMRPIQARREQEIANLDYFEQLPYNDRSQVDFSNVKGVQFLQPLFEFSGACAGCGETPYLRTLSQLFGDRMMVANATGCSSIYGGNLPTTPWAKNAEGQGPAWSNSLFEDNAEFGLGFRLTADQHHAQAIAVLESLQPALGEAQVAALRDAPQKSESELRAQRARVGELKGTLKRLIGNGDCQAAQAAEQLLSIADHLVRRSVWLVGGDGWAYDIGYGGLDHVLASGRDVNVLVMDTEVYSNTGGQASKSTPLGAVAKFAAGGKRGAKKDLAMQAMAYGNVYVARIALGANPQQALQALREAESYAGPSLILAYSHCIAHGINMKEGLNQQKLAVESGYWPLMRYNPILRKGGKNPFLLDALRPCKPLKAFADNEMRYRMLFRANPKAAQQLMQHAQEAVNLRWQNYEELASREAHDFHPFIEELAEEQTP